MMRMLPLGFLALIAVAGCATTDGLNPSKSPSSGLADIWLPWSSSLRAPDDSSGFSGVSDKARAIEGNLGIR